jgi:dihydrofolate reductase
MKVVMVAVASVNGKITKGRDINIYKWTSKEDSDLFFSLLSKNNLIVMGSQTYEAAKRVIKLSKETLRIVMTHNPKKYANKKIPGQLEFSSDSPKMLVRRLSNKYKQMLLVGGAQINAVFLEEGLVNEIYITIEPLLFGKGKNLISTGELEANLELTSSEKLNKKGTILLKYKVVK